MKNYLLILSTLVLSSCGVFDQSPESLAAEVNQEPEPTCDMSPEGSWTATSSVMFGTCGHLAPFWIFADEQGGISM